MWWTAALRTAQKFAALLGSASPTTRMCTTFSRKRADKTYYIVLLYIKADDLAIKKGCRFVKTASVPG